MKNVIAIVLAAGKGTRLNSKEIPKVMLKIGNRPMIEYCVKTLENLELDRILVIIGFKGELVKNALGKRVDYVWQKKQLGTGHAVLQTKNILKRFDGYVLISYGDMPFLTKQMYLDLLNKCKEKNLSSCVLTVKIAKNAPEWGRIVRDKSGNVFKIVENKDASKEEKKILEFNTGIYCFKAKDLFKCLKLVNNKNVQGEYYLTDVIEIMTKKKMKIDSMVTKDIKKTIGINRPEELEMARSLIKNKNN